MKEKSMRWIILLKTKLNNSILILPSWLGLSNTPTALLQRGKTFLPQWVSCYDTKQSDGEVPVMLELWGMQSTFSLALLSGPLWPGVVAPDKSLPMGQIELNCIPLLNWIIWNETVFDIESVLMLNWNVWNWSVLTKTILIVNWIVWIRTVWLNGIAWNRNVYYD